MVVLSQKRIPTMVRLNRDGAIDKKIGWVIRMHRVKSGMSQSELGKALGVSFQQIQKYENGKNAIVSSRIADLCQALEITPNELFGVTERSVSTSPNGSGAADVSR
jgi:transcriptional regulator with XRE-family HTH domain